MNAAYRLQGQLLPFAEFHSRDKQDRHLVSIRIDGDQRNRDIAPSQGQIGFEFEAAVAGAPVLVSAVPIAFGDVGKPIGAKLK